MAVAARRDDRMTVAEYRVWVDAEPTSELWERLDGLPVSMSPTSGRHQLIVTDLVRRLDDLAECKGCSALPGLAVRSEAMDDCAPIPDIVVQCGPLPRDGHTRDPLFAADVLSSSTMSMDRGCETDFVWPVPSRQPFLSVYQDAARVEVWRRESGWEMQMLGPGDGFDLPERSGAPTLRMSMPA